MSQNSTTTDPTSSTSSSTSTPTEPPTTSSESSTLTSSSASSSSSPPSSSEPPSTSESTTTPPPSSTTPPPSSSAVTVTPPDGNGGVVTTVTTSTQLPPSITPSSTSSSVSSSTTGSPTLASGSKSTVHSGLSTQGTIAVAVVVPIVAVALIVLAALFFWRKRKQRKDAEELRRKEVEEYGYNPNNDPTLPPGAAASDGAYEMREEGSSGYRGWGTTAVSSSGRKASTTLSGGGIGMAYSEGTSPSQAGPISDTRSDNPLVDGRPISGEAEALGVMGPAASGNRDINRGPSNASSSYSAANRSDGSGEIPVAGGAYYNNQYDTGNPYGETQYGSPPDNRAEMSGQPIIRDVQARRNTRIENPSHFPQQSAGISQNF